MEQLEPYNHPTHGGIIKRPDQTVYVNDNDISQNLDTESLPRHGGIYQQVNTETPPEGT